MEGALKDHRVRVRRALNTDDLANIRDVDPFASGIHWSSKRIIEYLSSNMGTREGQRMYGGLVAGEFKGNDGLRKTGPIISKEFAIAIQKRRKSLLRDGRKNLRKEILKKAKALAGSGSTKDLNTLSNFLNLRFLTKG